MRTLKKALKAVFEAVEFPYPGCKSLDGVCGIGWFLPAALGLGGMIANWLSGSSQKKAQDNYRDQLMALAQQGAGSGGSSSSSRSVSEGPAPFGPASTSAGLPMPQDNLEGLIASFLSRRGGGGGGGMGF